MSEEIQAEKNAAKPDTIQVVTSDSMQAFTEAKNSGEDFKPEAETEAKPQATAEEEAHAEPVQTENAVQEEGIWKPKEGKPLSKKQIEANERFSKATSDRKAAEARAAAAEREAAELKAKYEPKAEPINEKPDPQKYNDAEKYAEDYSAWKDGQRRATEAQERLRREASALQDRFNKDRDIFKATVSDWDERSASKADKQMHTEVITAIMESDHPAQIMYELTPEDVDRINGMPTIRAQLREITRLEQKISKGGAKVTPVAAKPQAVEVEVSRAPPPISPIKPTHSQPSNKVDKDGNFSGSQEEYEKLRREGKIGAAYH